MTVEEEITTSYAYDKDNRLVSVTDALGGVTTYTYDGLGQVTSITNALGGVTTTAYDANNQITVASNELAEEGSDTHRVKYEYNNRGFVTKRTNEDGTFCIL